MSAPPRPLPRFPSSTSGETRAVSSEAPAERLIREGSEPMLMRAKSPTISRMDTTRMPTSLANKASLQEMQHRKRTSVDLSSGRKDDAIAAASAAIAAVGAARKLATIELSLKVSMGSTKKKVAFDANDSVLEARRVVAREFKVRLEEVCLFVSRTGIWLKDNRTLSSYELTDADNIEVKKQPESGLATMKVTYAERELTETIAYAPGITTPEGIIQSLERKNAQSKNCKLFYVSATDGKEVKLKSTSPITYGPPNQPNVVVILRDKEKDKKKTTTVESSRPTSNSLASAIVGSTKLTTTNTDNQTVDQMKSPSRQLQRVDSKNEAEIAQAKKDEALAKMKLKKVTIDVLIEDLATSKQYTVDSEMKVVEFIEILTLDNELTDSDELILFYPSKIRNLSPNHLLKAYNFRPKDMLILKREKKKEKETKEQKQQKAMGLFKLIGSSLKTEDKSDDKDQESYQRAGPESIRSDIVEKLVEALINRNAEDCEGIFRISGSTAAIRELYCKLNTISEAELMQYGPHELSGALKLYFRECAVPAIPYEFYDDFMAVEVNGRVDTNQLTEVVQRLPEETRHILKTIVSFFLRVVAKASVNYMSPENIGIVFGPTLIRRSDGLIDFGKTSLMSDIVAEMITSSMQVFQTETETDDVIEVEGGVSDMEATSPAPNEDIKPSLKINWPNEETELRRGQVTTVKWESIDLQAKVSLGLCTRTDLRSKLITISTDIDLSCCCSFDWNPNMQLRPGEYYLALFGDQINTSFSAKFRIVSPPPSVPAPVPPTRANTVAVSVSASLSPKAEVDRLISKLFSSNDSDKLQAIELLSEKIKNNEFREAMTEAIDKERMIQIIQILSVMALANTTVTQQSESQTNVKPISGAVSPFTTTGPSNITNSAPLTSSAPIKKVPVVPPARVVRPSSETSKK